MSPADDSRDNDEMHEASDRLEEGLRSCRSVVNDYRLLLSSGQCDFSSQDQASPETSASDNS